MKVEHLPGQLPHLLTGNRVIPGNELVLVQDLPQQQFPPAQAAHAGLGGLQAHEHIGLGLLPGPVQLLLGGAVLGEVPDNGADGLQRLPLHVPVQGGVDPKISRVLVAGGIGVNAVAQPQPLPHLLKEPGGHAAPQDGGQQLEGKALRLPKAQAGKGQGEMVLFNGLLFHGDGGDIPGGGPGGGGAGRDAGEAGLQILHVLRAEAARQGHHNAVGVVVGAHELGKPGPVQPGQGGALPQNGPGQGRALEHRGGQPLGAQVLRVVLIHADFLQNDPPLQGGVPAVKAGVEEHIAQYVCTLDQMGIQHPSEEAGGLLGGISVNLPADGVHLFGQGGGGAALGAFEQHMLNKVGGSVFGGLFVAGAHTGPDTQGGGAHPRGGLQQNAHSVGEGYLFVHRTPHLYVTGYGPL